MEQAYLEFEKANGIKYYEKDKFLQWDQEERNKLYDNRVWLKDPYYFTTCHISAVAMLQMLLHAKRNEPQEIMGMLRGRTFGKEFVITDVLSLPSVGTETRIEIPTEEIQMAREYCDFLQSNGLGQEISGWFHTHPSYKCWLSTTDVKTQARHQRPFDPFVAIVVDPTTTTNNGAIEIGAFRTFPEGVPSDSSNGKRILPSEKLKDFGASWDKYYTMKVEIFKTELDERMLKKLWREYWITTLSASPIISNRDLIDTKVIDLYQKMQEKKKHGMKTTTALKELNDDIDEIGFIFQRGTKSLEIKNLLFNQKFDN